MDYLTLFDSYKFCTLKEDGLSGHSSLFKRIKQRQREWERDIKGSKTRRERERDKDVLIEIFIDTTQFTFQVSGGGW